MLRSALLLAVAFAPANVFSDPVEERHYRVFRGNGTAATLEEVIAESRAASVTFLGETHDDPTAHHLEEQMLRGAWDSALALSLEMFETDVQYVLDEYLAGLISEEHLQSSGRAWKTYNPDYRPLIEFAKEKKMAVIAANPPRRYVNRVSRLGAQSLLELDGRARGFLPPLPYADSSPEYAAKFKREMEKHREGDKPTPPETIARRLQVQTLWDAGMAYSIATFLTSHPGRRILHVNGSFHTAERLGIVEHLARYRPGTRALVITILRDRSFPSFDSKKMSGQGDFVIVTDPKVLNKQSRKGKNR